MPPVRPTARACASARGLLHAVLDVPPLRRAAFVAQLRPRPGDFEHIFLGGAAGRARYAYRDLWAAPPSLGPTRPTLLEVRAAPAGALASDAAARAGFAPQYRALAPSLVGTRVWVSWRAVGAGGAFEMDALVWLEERWIWLPRPWLYLAGATHWGFGAATCGT